MYAYGLSPKQLYDHMCVELMPIGHPPLGKNKLCAVPVSGLVGGT